MGFGQYVLFVSDGSMGEHIILWQESKSVDVGIIVYLVVAHSSSLPQSKQLSSMVSSVV